MSKNSSENNSNNSICESCGKEFFCGANVGKCWCFTLELKAETLTELRKDFEKCLCEACLVKSNLFSGKTQDG